MFYTWCLLETARLMTPDYTSMQSQHDNIKSVSHVNTGSTTASGEVSWWFVSSIQLIIILCFLLTPGGRVRLFVNKRSEVYSITSRVNHNNPATGKSVLTSLIDESLVGINHRMGWLNVCTVTNEDFPNYSDSAAQIFTVECPFWTIGCIVCCWQRRRYGTHS